MLQKFILPLFLALAWCVQAATAQTTMTPELLWQLGRVSGVGLSDDGQQVVYAVSTPNLEQNKSATTYYALPLKGGTPQPVANPATLVQDRNVSPDGRYTLTTKEVLVKKVTSAELYPDLPQADAYVFESLNYRHWDTWEDGKFSHLFLHPMQNGQPGEGKDIMPGEPYDTPQQPFGGEEDYTWSPDSKTIVYVTKRAYGTDYAVSTNTDLFAYDVATGQTHNLTETMKGYDVAPAFSTQGALAWLSMKRDGYESDKNDLMVRSAEGIPLNLTQQWDGTVNSFLWSQDGKRIYFTAPVDGTIQLFQVDYPGRTKKMPVVEQLTEGDFDVNGIVGQSGNTLVVSRTDMNHAAELYTVDLKKGTMQQLTHVNDATYSRLSLSKVEKRMVPTTDGQQMLVWVIYPPDFDASKKYPTLLYCQGGPQAALTQFYSYRWNFQLMAAQGYIVVAPNRRGMPGHGVAWNEQISGDWGGQVMQDYLSAIDAVAEEPFVDKARLGCVGASFGGYSVFYLAGIHEGRFQSFIAHDGVFDLKSMYGTTEELWFVNWDFGGPYWTQNNAEVQKTYEQFDPSSRVAKWDTPILIVQGGKDYRVPIGQGLEAFQAAQLQGLKSKLLYFTDENHWVLKAQNALVWQREFFKWLDETL
ncbi:Dipeptidyl aminopeptidase/acylaminoacyl peptidase [Catalinimonas alkaloidigena]|uniref:Dipeptidyl aminopeptidase/acylaminoacyl peptidase n=1 Tax=Catalinimonas alkaloidigena TaxID=1075417 RepID=A0A1G9K3B8_9BACT|nr:S9 family peptidase [Catalinimonas alkaloidigena]SDL43835.1 Dipeptidyl aminopeptidase/acylaminoacyl peptidase [Catalinimonas alkaloidigena]